MPPVTRDARPEDARRIEEIRVAGWHAAYGGLLDRDWLAALTVTDDRITTWAQRIREPAPGAVYLVSESGDDVVGLACLLPGRDEDVPAAGELAALYVDPSRWQGGHGSALLAAGFARTLQPVQLLWVLAGNAHARAFYERHGFAPDGAEKVLDVPGRPLEVRYRRARLA